MALAPSSSHGIDTSTANTWTANQTAPAWIASGLTGATAASRYVGATASGAPGSGTFAIGDFVIDQTAKVFICTVAGSPGTWAQAGGSQAQLASQTLVGAAATIDFSGISAAYNHLQVWFQGRGSAVAVSAEMYARFNNDSGANYDWQVMRQSSVTQQAVADTNGVYLGAIIAASGTADVATSAVIDIPFYANTTFQKTAYTRKSLKTGTTTADIIVYANSGFYRSLTAISQVTLRLASGNFIAGSSATLYGYA